MMRLKHLLTGLGLLACIGVRAQEAPAPVRTDSIAQPQPVVRPDSTTERLKRVELQLETLATEKEALTTEKLELEAEKTALEAEKTALKELLTESQQQVFTKDQEIERLGTELAASKRERETRVKELESKNDSLLRVMISMASNFIYIPYEQYSIEQIAIPAFQSTQNSALYDEYRIRLEMLQSYRADVEFLVGYLTPAIEELSIGLTALREQKAQEYASKLTLSATYLRYTRYDDWKATFLGRVMSEILADLKSPSAETASKLGTIRDNLSKTLNNQ